MAPDACAHVHAHAHVHTHTHTIDNDLGLQWPGVLFLPSWIVLFSSSPISDFEPPETRPLSGQGAQEVPPAPNPLVASFGACLATPEVVAAVLTRLGQQPGATETGERKGPGWSGSVSREGQAEAEPSEGPGVIQESCATFCRWENLGRAVGGGGQAAAHGGGSRIRCGPIWWRDPRGAHGHPGSGFSVLSLCRI